MPVGVALALQESMDNADIARLLDETADLLEIRNDNPFRIRAYRRAARVISTLAESVTSIIERDPKELNALPGIGADLAGKIASMARTGVFPLRDTLAKRVPAGVVEMMRIPGLGPKRAALFYHELGLRTVDALEAAARAGRLLEVRGVGEVLQGRILQGCEERHGQAGRCLLGEADIHVAPLLDHLRASPGVERIVVAGSYRRRRETVGDLDLLVVTRDPAAAADRFVSYSEVKEVLAHGPTRSAIVLRSGLQADLRVVSAESYGAALVYFTGSKAHNIALRKLGLERKLKINEYGVFRGQRRKGGATEEEIYAAVDLPWIPPELREDRGELDAARDGHLPSLVALDDIRGDLHMHTAESDGADSAAEMVEACRVRGYAYMALTDHSPAVRIARGLDPAGFRRQARAIAALQEKHADIRIFKGAEVDILADGSLDLPDRVLAELDVVVVSVHSQQRMSEGQMTERIIRGISHPRATILAHPTGRRLGTREPYAVDMAKVARAARAHGVLLEINAQPERLDLSDVYARLARDAGATLVVSSDAHRHQELDFIRYGVDQARRAWCTAADIANTWPLRRLERMLKGAPRAAAAHEARSS